MDRPPATPKIRAAVSGDVTAILQVRRQAILVRAGSHYDPVILNDWADAANAGRIARRIADPDFRTPVAEVGGEIIGFAMAAPQKANRWALRETQPDRLYGRDLLAAIDRSSSRQRRFWAARPR